MEIRVSLFSLLLHKGLFDLRNTNPCLVLADTVVVVVVETGLN